MESFFRNLTEQVICSICLETYKKPKIISCFHTFCCDCLQKHATKSQRNGKFRCPECQAEIELPEGNRFHNLPASFFHNRLLSLLAVRESGHGTSITCGNCKKTSQSNVHYCFDCFRFMCLDCLNAHEVMSTDFGGHKVMPVKDFQDQDYEALLKQQHFCSKKFHEKQIKRFFCLQCQSSICNICIITDHQNHKVDLIDNMAENEKGNITANAALVRERRTDLKKVLRQIEETELNLERNVASAKAKVIQAAEHMIAQIREREKEAIASLETTRVTRLESINSSKAATDSLVKQMDQVVEFAENLSQRSSSSDVMENKDNLRQKFIELREIEFPIHHDTSFIKFVPSSMEDLKLGIVFSEGMDPDQFNLEGLDQTLQAGVKAEFLLSPKVGGYSTRMDLKEEIEITVEPMEDVTDVMVCDGESGKLVLIFTPKAPGAYNIEVKISGNKLQTSPFTVLAVPREIVVVGELDLKLSNGEELQRPFRIAVNTKEEMAITDISGHCIFLFDKKGTFLRKIGGQGEIAGKFHHPHGLAFVSDNDILVADSSNHRIQQTDVCTGKCVKSFGKYGRAKGEFAKTSDVYLDEELRVVVTEESNHRVQIMSLEGETMKIFGNEGPEKLDKPTSCISYKDRFLVCDGGNNCIKVFGQSGTFLNKIGKQGDQDGQFNWPLGIHLDHSENLFVCDCNNNRVQQFSIDGRFTGKSASCLAYPTGIATTPDGRILVACRDKVYILN